MFNNVTINNQIIIHNTSTHLILTIGLGFYSAILKIQFLHCLHWHQTVICVKTSAKYPLEV